LPDGEANCLGLPDVALRGREVLVPCALLDLERLRAGERLPRDAGGAEVVERDPFRGGSIGEQVRAIDPGAAKVLAKVGRQVLDGWEPVLRLLVRVVVLNDAAHTAARGAHHVEQRDERARDRDLSCDARLGRFHVSRAQVKGLVDADVAVPGKDISPLQCREFAWAEVQVRHERVEAPPA